ncbi:inner centromere protein-like isoform X2 [Coturnix japonica]|uniref:inner centromere protein-like isoform X2 n=1 Tax=Coturnix japonica TaxID=93934 RepID=UPI0007774B6D|nr:inner centromere protein-like isoform X2 [Coturnix japonica]
MLLPFCSLVSVVVEDSGGKVMAAADGPMRLLEVCGQRLSRFLYDAEHKHLAWLREVEEQGMRMLDSNNFRAEPGLMPKTPSQRRRPRKRQSSALKDENEPTRRRLSRRRSSIKLASSRLSSQRCCSKEHPQNPVPQEEEVRSWADTEMELPALPEKLPAEAQSPMVKVDCGDCPQAEVPPQQDSADYGDAPCEAVPAEKVTKEDELHEAPAVSAVPDDQTAGEEEEATEQRASTSTPKATRNRDPAMLHGDLSSQSLEKELFQDNKVTAVISKPRRSGRRSLVGGAHKSHTTSLAEKYSLASKRENMIRRSISRAIAKKAAAQESSSASSRVSCQSSLEVFVEDDVANNLRTGVELNSPGEKAPEDMPASSKSERAASPPEQQTGNNEEKGVNPNGEAQNKNQEQVQCAKSQENPSRVWTRSCKQAMGVIWNRQHPGGGARSPLDDKHVNSANQTPPSASPASKVVRPLKNFLQGVQRNQLLTSSGSAGHGGVIRNFIKRNTLTRPDLKEKERQRLESLRKKQEAEEQRRKKVEEEKRRRQAEMKQKREERLRKALQARERVEQMEEEKKKRMEQKILQSDEKVRLSQGLEEKTSEERSKKKLSKKPWESDVRKQKILKSEEDKLEQQELLQKRREVEVEEKGKVLELKNLVEQRQVEQVKERDLKQCEKEKAPYSQMESMVFTDKNTTKGDGLQEPQQQPAEKKKIEQPESFTAAASTWLSKTVKKSISTSCVAPPKDTKESRSPNNYGMDLNSDDSTDDENDPRKPVPAWADGSQLNQAILHQYYHPVNIDQLFGSIASPKLEDIFGKSKPRYFKRTSSAVWHSPPEPKSTCGKACSFKN